MYFKSIFVLIGVLIISSTCYSQSDVSVDSTSYNSIIGMERSEAYKKLGVSYSGGTIIGWVEPSPRPIMTHSFAHATFDSKNIFMLMRVDDRSHEKMDSPSFVLDQMIISADNPDYLISYMGCTLNGQSYYPDGAIIAVYKDNGQKVVTDIEKAWKASFRENKFIEISPKNIQCKLTSGSYILLDSTELK
ncbi:hypothetical protein [Gracilimonas sp.]|uniref:hypothetical protein n=1 Tax=Gracilimonas sp. TaxID=1974203 RepID=UPI0032EC80F2